MADKYSIDEKIYPSEPESWSIRDMLNYFERRGTMRVSDLHIKVGAAPCFRVDGNLVKLKGPPVTEEVAEKLIFPLLSEDDRQAYRRDNNVDCSYKTGTLQYRINVFKDNDGISAAIRALTMDIPDIESIGFPNNVWSDIVDRKQGLVLVTGITGAGKSTTIASFLNRISEKYAHRIITIEDPIEYIFPQKRSIISQREVGRDVSSFSDGLRSMMREDPDVIFVGEMRDPETISMTLMAAETGHLVFSTLHTRDAVGSITRILDYFPPERQKEVSNQLSLGLRYIISQKLVPKKGGQGRMVAMEILNNQYAVANLIRTAKIEQLYSQMQTRTRDRPSEKMITMESHLARLVKEDKLDLLEARKWTNNLTGFMDMMKR